ncbi:MAG: hypothetical protein QF752_14205, partial [Planctomycetota bacterium]|nr:hypothetical protein [Planctomycetota bacterium]
MNEGSVFADHAGALFRGGIMEVGIETLKALIWQLLKNWFVYQTVDYFKKKFRLSGRRLGFALPDRKRLESQVHSSKTVIAIGPSSLAIIWLEPGRKPAGLLAPLTGDVFPVKDRQGWQIPVTDVPWFVDQIVSGNERVVVPVDGGAKVPIRGVTLSRYLGYDSNLPVVELPEDKDQALSAAVQAVHRMYRKAFEDEVGRWEQWKGAKPIVDFQGALCALDIEAGSSASLDANSVEWSEIREIGALFLSGDREVVFRMELDLSKRDRSKEEVERILKEELVRHQVTFLIGHNVEKWDLPVLRSVFSGISWPRTLDTLRFARMIRPLDRSHALDALRQAGVVGTTSRDGRTTHTAIVDAEDSMNLLFALLKQGRSVSKSYLRFVMFRFGVIRSLPEEDELLGTIDDRWKNVRLASKGRRETIGHGSDQEGKKSLRPSGPHEKSAIQPVASLEEENVVIAVETDWS